MINANKLVAHRGDNKNYPENSYAALESALKAGALFIEFDLQMSADGSLLVFHDIDFKRVANKQAASQSSIFEVTEEQLKQLSVHQPDLFKEKFNPTPVPYFHEILDLLKQYPKAHAFVEIKRESLAKWGMPEVVDKVLETLKGLESQITIISFSLTVIKYVQQHSELRTGFVFYHYNECTYHIATILQPDFLICAYDIFPEKDQLWQGKWQWMVYSINEVSTMKQFMKRDEISLIETDAIRLMLEAGLEQKDKNVKKGGDGQYV